MAEQKMVTIQFDNEAVTNAVLEQMREVAEEQAGTSVRAAAREIAEKVVREAVEKEARAFAAEHLREAVAKIIAEGWKQTNNYGDPIGKTITLESFVRDYLFKGSGYHDRPLEQILKESVAVAMKGELGGILAEATAKLRSMVDQTIADKLRGVVDQAISAKRA